MKPLIIHAEAQEELDAAVGYYEVRSEGLGLDFLAVVSAGLSRIGQHPDRYPRHRRTVMRRHLLKRFPYAIIYREYDDRISIVAIAHGLRRPDYWKNREPQ